MCLSIRAIFIAFFASLSAGSQCQSLVMPDTPLRMQLPCLACIAHKFLRTLEICDRCRLFSSSTSHAWTNTAGRFLRSPFLSVQDAVNQQRPENETIGTRNQRLAVIHALVRAVDPNRSVRVAGHRVLDMPASDEAFYSGLAQITQVPREFDFPERALPPQMDQSHRRPRWKHTS
jgi:hypothetical protein